MVTKPTIRIASKRSSLIEAIVILISSANQANASSTLEAQRQCHGKGHVDLAA
jgi:hypothetical protein